MKLVARLFILCLLICLVSCSRQPPPDGKRSQREFSSLVGSFPYKASEKRNAEIVASVPKLKTGMSKEEVQQAIGEPDYSEALYRSGLISTKYYGSEWMYCIYCASQFVGTTGGEKYVVIYFDMDGKVNKIGNYVKGDMER